MTRSAYLAREVAFKDGESGRGVDTHQHPTGTMKIAEQASGLIVEIQGRAGMYGRGRDEGDAAEAGVTRLQSASRDVDCSLEIAKTENRCSDDDGAGVNRGA